MYTLTVTFPDLANFLGFAHLIEKNEYKCVAEAPGVVSATREPKPKAEKKEKVSTPVTNTDEIPVVSFSDVKKVVLDIAAAEGREASLDFLSQFGVVEGEGDKRKGDMSKLKPELYAAVLEAAKERA